VAIRDTCGVTRPLLLAAALVWLVCGSAGVASAGDGDSAFSLGAGAGTFTLPGAEEDETIAPIAGGLVIVTYERGFSEALSWRLEASGALYGGGGLSWSGAAAAGLVYRFDVLKYVPYGLVELGASYLGGGPVPSPVLDPLVEVGGGVDILQSRTRSWGVEARLAGFAGDTTLISLSARYTWRWGFF
jgi:hypothetical protein